MTMQLGMIGLGRMGTGMVRRLLRDGHDCVVHDTDAARVDALAAEGARGAASLAELAAMLAAPRAVWMMVPVARVDEVLTALADVLEPGDVIVDGGNSHFLDDRRRAESLAARGIAFLDVGTSGGVWGLERGYCLMIGGEAGDVARLEPAFRSLAPGAAAAPPTPARAEI
ncbi:MAG: NAD(P)-binding domain-containing protein, partial [Gammaproteobacteria bacterium]|nr:NAD(P)-binding domain-containing protein [Gammaproteobacteria bacterium]